jgi:ankyrin repeat protein
MSECLKTLYTSSYKDHKARNPDRVNGTCRWFLKHGSFVQWLQSTKSSLLWLSADPGCGKSVLSKSLIDNELSNTQTRTTCYFFFKDDNTEQKSATNALCALLHQLFSRKKSLLSCAVRLYEETGAKFHESFEELWQILLDAAGKPEAGEIVCLLDGLDECEESARYKLIDKLKAFYSGEKSGVALKFLVTSRPYYDIERRFRELTSRFPAIHLAGEEETPEISHEIDFVIESKVKDIASDLGLDDAVKLSLERRLTKITHRTYLWLKLIFEVIYLRLDLATEKRLQSIIGEIPDTVDKAYEEILSRTRDIDAARKLLHIVVSAARPLSLREMNLALAINEGARSEKDLDLEPEHLFQIRVRNLCCLFVSVIDSKIYLIHQTAKDFLVCRGITDENNPHGAWKHTLVPEESNLIVARICLSYLLLDVFEQQPLLLDDGSSHEDISSTVDGYMEQHAFLDYAANEWFTHLREAKTRGDSATLENALHVINTQSNKFLTWFQVVSTTFDRGIRHRGVTELMVASYCGIPALVQLLLDRGEDIATKDKEGWTALHWVLVGMRWDPLLALKLDTEFHQHVLPILLKKLAQMAGSKRVNTIIPTVVAQHGQKGRDIGLVDDRVETPDDIQKIQRRGSLQDMAVQSLLCDAVSAAENSSQGLIGDRLGAEIWFEMVVHHVLSEMESVTTPRSGMSSVVEQLIMEGAEIGSERREGTPGDTDEASVRRITAVAEKIFENAVAMRKTGSAPTKLQLAAELGYKLIAILLQKEGVDNAFFQACGSGCSATIQLLLRNGLDVNLSLTERGGGWGEGDSHWTKTPAIHIAAARGNTGLVRLLLQEGADPNACLRKVEENGAVTDVAPLIAIAVEMENLEQVRLLLGNGANPNRQYDGRTPLHLSVLAGNHAIVQMLLDNGAEMNANIESISEPLRWAEASGGTALHLAVLQRNYRILRLLLRRKRINIGAVTGSGETALQLATKLGDQRAVELLQMARLSCLMFRLSKIWRWFWGRGKFADNKLRRKSTPKLEPRLGSKSTLRARISQAIMERVWGAEMEISLIGLQNSGKTCFLRALSVSTSYIEDARATAQSFS